MYPLLKEVALAGAPGSKAMKQVTQQIFTFALRLAGEGISPQVLSPSPLSSPNRVCNVFPL